ncbi:hypothetical protein [Tropicibacter naphthalenivorans]|uniref:Uncharacterized protein n=1 Tax=Tropicibacter naphthalenivorans TaxID=441103 RepID=A0A0N7M0C2_9RHOB|nr:hypothetical protein [Tropicibacter naphthalenivorans]CUH80057.1 hypothetical protein TRN7648_02776 [Tropicibacter naphthalenivorans]SMC84154.1 hypothetical protein SAMN04488093_10545 [Tropicibacter naphthalenivorans]
MNAMNTTAAQLIFDGERLVSLPNIADLLGADLRVLEAGLTSLTLTDGALTFDLELAFVAQETLLTLSILGNDDVATLQARLAPMLYTLAKTLPIQAVVWGETALRIPAQTLVAGLAASFEPAETVTPIAPRRVSGTKPATARPSKADLAQMLPQVNSAARMAAANDNADMGAPQFDAHVKAFETSLRATLLRPASKAEIEEIRAEDGIIPIEARLSTWAVSLTVATVSLPVAAPIMAYNVMRGEDLRAASLAMGLAGFFVAMDTSGAMAGIASML